METILDFTRRSLGMPRISKIVIAICENVPRYRWIVFLYFYMCDLGNVIVRKT